MIGIYCIKNKVNGKVYISSSNDIKRRIRKHKTELNTGIHSNKYLNRAYNKYGSNNFEFIVLEECDTENLIERELHYISLYDALNRKKGYNLSVPIKHPSITSNKEYRSILSASKKGIRPSNYKQMIKSRWIKIKVYINNVFYKEFQSYSEAERELGINKGYIYSYFKNPNQKRRKYLEYKFEKV